MNSTKRTINTNYIDGVLAPRNYITNGKATAANTIGWATYADAAQSTPENGTGGSPNVTISTSSTSPLSGDNSFTLVKDAANRQGQGWSYDFTIDSCDQAKVLQISLEYLVSSGTFVAGTSTADSDVTVWIYDVTNSAVIQPSTFRLYSNSSTLSTTVVSNFQTASNSTSYRLIMHVGSTSASAYTLKIDNVSVSPTQYVYGSPITDWQSYTPTFTGLGTNTSIEYKYRRVGSNLEVVGKSTIGTTSATEARISLPSGLTSADTNTLPSIRQLGTWVNGVSSANHGGSVLVEPSVTYMTFNSGATFGSGTFNAMTKQNGNNIGLTDSSSQISLIVSVPIQGWTSTVQMSDSADTREVTLVATGIATGGSTGNPIIWGTSTKDTHTGYSTSTGRYTVPVAGNYHVEASVSANNTGVYYAVYKNAAIFSNIGQVVANPSVSSGAAIVPCVAGDILDVRPVNGGVGTVAVTTSLCITRISGPTAIASTESINARYYASATSISGSLTTISWTTKDFDSHNAMSSGTFTVPASGKYQVNSALLISGTVSLNNTVILEIQKNGSVVSRFTEYLPATLTNAKAVIDDIISCVAGDTIRIQVSTSIATPSIVSSNFDNYVSIARVGAF